MWVRVGAATSRPSTAVRTEIAGVIMPSPYSNAVPNKPSSTKAEPRLAVPNRVVGDARAVNARIPPSPALSARMTTTRYLIVTTMISDHNIVESTPITSTSPTSSPPARNVSRNA